MLDSLELNITTEYRVYNFIEHMRVVNFSFKVDLLAFGALGLYVVLPKVSLLLVTPG